MDYSVYIIKNSDGKIYIGYSANLLARLKSHNEGRSFYTKNKGPWRLIHQENFESRAEAMRREKFLKKTKRW